MGFICGCLMRGEVQIEGVYVGTVAGLLARAVQWWPLDSGDD
jgi:hypothetical protein